MWVTCLHPRAWIPKPHFLLLLGVLYACLHIPIIGCRILWLPSPLWELGHNPVHYSLLPWGEESLNPTPGEKCPATLKWIMFLVTSSWPSLQAITHHTLSIHWVRILIHGMDSFWLSLVMVLCPLMITLTWISLSLCN